MEVLIDRLDHYGRGITTINNKICFVENALPGEIVEINIINEKKKYLEAEVINYINKSKDRVEDVCPYSNICGGCNLNHMSYDDENKFKEEKVKDLISKFSGLDKDLVKSIYYDKEFNYRNKVVFHVKDKKLGLYKNKSNDIVEIDKCLLLDENINKFIPKLKELVKVNEIEEITIKVSNDSKYSMIVIRGVVNDLLDIKDLFDVVVINKEVISKDNRILTNIGNYKFLLSSEAFFQVNKYVTKKLYDEVLENVKKYNSKNVLDLYCGTGTIGIYVSSYVDKVFGIEINKEAVKDANKNKELNNINNIEFKSGRVEHLIEEVKEKFDTIIVDPPRSGLDNNTINNIFRINPDTLIYVSCDPTTLSRDLNTLKENYTIKYIKPFNMFPRTYHCESVCILERR